MAVNAASLSQVDLSTTDTKVYKGFYTEVWARETAENEAYIAAFLANITKWNWGFTDTDFCCTDGSSPSYMLHSVKSARHATQCHQTDYCLFWNGNVQRHTESVAAELLQGRQRSETLAAEALVSMCDSGHWT